MSDLRCTPTAFSTIVQNPHFTQPSEIASFGKTGEPEEESSLCSCTLAKIVMLAGIIILLLGAIGLVGVQINPDRMTPINSIFKTVVDGAQYIGSLCGCSDFEIASLATLTGGIIFLTGFFKWLNTSKKH